MGIYAYPSEIVDFITANVQGTTTKELVLITNAKFSTDFTESKMKSFKTNHKLKSGTPGGWPVGRFSDSYPEEVCNFIENNHIGVGHKNMAEQLNKTFGTSYSTSQMKSYYGRHKLNSGLKGWFPKGNVPPNKGKKGICAPGSEKGWFQKGQVPTNHKPIGSERIDVDGYTLIKIKEPRTWALKHKLIWEEKNGPVPKGYAVIFGDGNKQNLDINNLLLVSRKKLLVMNRNSLIQNETELTKTGAIIADIYMKIGEQNKKRSKQKE